MNFTRPTESSRQMLSGLLSRMLRLNASLVRSASSARRRELMSALTSRTALGLPFSS
jgi:hypothetical protein